ncbi:hypothetical protein K7432_002239 [Basidiobolus ranarum]|uniref:MIR domain-containing protein n=1 Tax=Basidiobolus ranarum TaxID=34480 RepID=A0ABR2W8E3_9FUNG
MNGYNNNNNQSNYQNQPGYGNQPGYSSQPHSGQQGYNGRPNIPQNGPSGGYEQPLQEYQQQYQHQQEKKKKWQIAGGIAAGALAVGAATLGAKYLADHHGSDSDEEKKPVNNNNYQNNNNNYEHNNNNNYQNNNNNNGGCYVPPPQPVSPNCNPSAGCDVRSDNYHNYSAPSGQTGITPHAYPVLDQYGNSQIKIGSKITLKHNNSGRFLTHSWSSPNNGGSGQPLPSCGGWNAGQDEFWQVIPANGDVLVPGQPLDYGCYVRLRHIQTKHHLHSHFDSCAPASGLQEVTCFGDEMNSDNNDHWKVEKWEGGCGPWMTGDSFCLRHVHTNRFLRSGSSMIDAEHQEVNCGGNGVDENDRWRVVF